MRLGVPIALAGLTDQLLGTVDTVVLSRLGTMILAEVTAAAGCYVVAVVAVTGLCLGVRILGSRTFGENAMLGFGAVVRASALPALVLGLVLAAVCPLVARPIIHAMLPAAHPGAAGYLVARACALPFVAATTAITAAFSATGDSRLTLRTLLVVNTVHLPLVVLLSVGAGPWHGLGIVGAGVSSTVAEIVGFLYALLAALRRTDIGLTSSWDVDAHIVGAAVRLSWPESVNLLFLLIPEPLTIAMLGSMPLVSAYRALAVVNDVCSVLPFSIAEAAQILMAQAIGARDDACLNGVFRCGMRWSVGLSAIVAVAIVLTAHFIGTLLTGNPTVADAAALPLAMHVGITLPVKSYAGEVEARLYAAGDTTFIMWIGIAAASMALALVFLCTRLQAGLFSVPVAWTAAWSLRAAAVRWRSTSFRGLTEPATAT